MVKTVETVLTRAKRFTLLKQGVNESGLKNRARFCGISGLGLTTLFFIPYALAAQEPWEGPLAAMPLGSNPAELNRSNCVGLLLGAFQSNDVVKALVFMPGATDEFYFFKRARAALTNSHPTLLDAVNALRDQTRIHATFRPPLLLLHTIEDPLEPAIKVDYEAGLEKIKVSRFVPHGLYNDSDWGVMQPLLRKMLKVDVWPDRQSPDSWHFYRHSFAGWNLTGWEAIQAVTLAGKSTCLIQKQGGLSLRRTVVFFSPDPRVVAVPSIEAFPR